MITKSKTFKIASTDTDVVSLTWTAITSSSCITLSSSTGTISGNEGTISLVLTFTNTACIENESLTITAVDNFGCSFSSTYTFSNDCDLTGTVGLSSVQDTKYTFQSSITNGTAPYTYEWVYDPLVFSGSSTNNNITLSLVSPTPPSSTLISAKVTDNNGCEVYSNLEYTFSKPTVQNASASLSCTTQSFTECLDAASYRKAIQLNATAYEGKTIDWTTLEFTTNTTNLCIENQGAGIIDIYAKSAASTGLRSIAWSVKDNYGLQSDSGNLNIVIPVCTEVETEIDIPNVDIVISPVFGDITRIDIEQGVANADRIDWTTFDFVAATGQTKVSSTSLTASNGAAVLENKQIKYTFDTQTVPVDLVQFDLQDTNGNNLNTAKYYLDAEPTSPPVAVNDSLTVVLGEINTVNLLTNDTGIIDKTSVQTVTSPTKGAVSISNGILSFNANGTSIGADTLTYTVKNTNGVVSNTATVNVTIISAGTDYTASHCEEGDAYNLETKLGAFTAGGAWAASGSNPSVISVASPTAISFSGATDGTYVFTYTVTSGGETDVATVSIDYKDYSFVTTTSTIIASTGFTYEINSSVTVEGYSNNVQAFLYSQTTPAAAPITGGTYQEELQTTYDFTNKKFHCTTTNLVQGNTYQILYTGTDPCGTTRTINSVTLAAL